MSKAIIAREFAKKTFVQTGVKKTLEGWAAYVTIGNQSFTLTDTETKSQALWFEKMVNLAIVQLLLKYSVNIKDGLAAVHTHAEIAAAQNPEQVVYRRSDVEKLLNVQKFLRKTKR